jgi:hypothetical protein
MEKIGKLIVIATVSLVFLGIVSGMPKSPDAPDLVPGSRFTVGQDFDGRACQNDNLAVGQYVSQMCAGDASRIVRPHLYGLGETPRRRGGSWFWIRVNTDAVMLACDWDKKCEIEALVRDRFVSDPSMPEASAYKGMGVVLKRSSDALVTPRCPNATDLYCATLVNGAR